MWCTFGKRPQAPDGAWLIGCRMVPESLILTQTVDALVCSTEEGRARRTKLAGKEPRSCDPAVSEWSNPAKSNLVTAL